MTIAVVDGDDEVSHMAVVRRPQPLTPGVARWYFATAESDDEYVLEDLSAAGGSGEAFSHGQSCTHQAVCHPASFEPLGPVHVSASWTATGDARRFQDFGKQDVSRLTFEECVYTSNSTGWRRPATASLVIANIPLEGLDGWVWSLGSPVSASIGEFRAISSRRCKSAF